MNTKLIKSLTIAALCASATAALAQAPGNSAYLIDQRGVLAKSGYNLCWRTGYWTPAQAIAECDPDLVPKPAPAKPPVAAAPKKCDFTYTLQADETFAFNKSTLTAKAKKKIDAEVIGKLGNCSKIDMILVTGHTDRLGSQEYNQKLSEKRANAVKAYLKSKKVTANIDTMGAGKTQQVKGCSEIDEKKSRKKLIECLAPNRRVVVEVKGPAK